MRSPWVSSAIVLLALAPRPARADDAGKGGNEAEALFEQARALMARDDYAAACPRLEKSDALDPGIGTELNLARCYDLAGKPARASAMYQRVIDATVVAGQTDRETAARQLQAALGPRIAYATIGPAPHAELPGLQVRCDGALVDWAAKEATPLDPGPHIVEATAPGRVPWRGPLDVRREGQRVALVIPLLELVPLDEAVAPAPPAARPAFAGDSRSSSPSANLQRPFAAVALGTAVVAAGVGTYFGAKKLSLASEANTHCGSHGCDPEGVTASQDSIPVGNWATGAFVASGALLATSAILWFTAPRNAPARNLTVAPTMSASGASLLMLGHW